MKKIIAILVAITITHAIEAQTHDYLRFHGKKKSGSGDSIYFAKSTLIIDSLTFRETPYPLPILSVIDTSNFVYDGNNEWVNGGKSTVIQIKSRYDAIKGWIQTKNIVIKNCKIKGSIRILGLGVNGEAAGVKESSISLGHTERAQAAAPTNILLSNVTIEGGGNSPVYISPGTTHVTVENSFFTGTSGSVTIYMDAESGYNTIKNNRFETVCSGTREAIAVDGSAHNVIEGNTFPIPVNGGIYLYRNCGEGGTVRHQSSQYNTISNNVFIMTNMNSFCSGIWLCSRNGNRNYCGDDSGYNFGSSISDLDYADNNTIIGNTFIGSGKIFSSKITDDGNNNSVK